MAYKLDLHPDACAHVMALPPGAPIALAEAFAMIELVPWHGEPYNKKKPDGNMRQVVFGADGVGLIIYLILEDQQRVDVLLVQRLG